MHATDEQVFSLEENNMCYADIPQERIEPTILKREPYQIERKWHPYAFPPAQFLCL